MIFAATSCDPIIASDDAHYSAMEVGSRLLSDATCRLRNGMRFRTPATLIWRRDTGGRADAYEGKPDLLAEREEAARLQWQHRDPCFRCGARADFGCGCRERSA